MTRIYVACLAAYNSGTLHGEWIDDLDMFDGDEVRERIAQMLARSPQEGAEEYAVHDHEGFGDYGVGEWPDIDELCQVARLIAEHGHELVSVALEHTTVDKADEWLLEHYMGQWQSLEHWAEEWLSDTGVLGDVPESMRCYIDFAGWARDCEINGEIMSREISFQEVHVFNT